MDIAPHEARCAALGNWAMSVLVSANTPSAIRRPMPGMPPMDSTAFAEGRICSSVSRSSLPICPSRNLTCSSGPLAHRACVFTVEWDMHGESLSPLLRLHCKRLPSCILCYSTTHGPSCKGSFCELVRDLIQVKPSHLLERPRSACPDLRGP